MQPVEIPVITSNYLATVAAISIGNMRDFFATNGIAMNDEQYKGLMGGLYKLLMQAYPPNTKDIVQ